MYNYKRGEDTEQIGVIEWANWNCNRYPELELLFHVPNGGKRNTAEAARFKAMGVKSGVPDLCLPVPKGGYAGLYIEMKYGKNKTTENQDKWLEALKKQGYKTTICYSGAEATEQLEEYLKKPQTILCDPRKARPDKPIAIYCKTETAKKWKDMLLRYVTGNECFASVDDTEIICTAPENIDVAEGKEQILPKSCWDCIQQYVEFHEYD